MTAGKDEMGWHRHDIRKGCLLWLALAALPIAVVLVYLALRNP